MPQPETAPFDDAEGHFSDPADESVPPDSKQPDVSEDDPTGGWSRRDTVTIRNRVRDWGFTSYEGNGC